MPTVIRRSANRVRSPTKACKHPDPPANNTAKIRANLRPNLSPINPRMKAPENIVQKILKQVEYESARRERHINEKTRKRDEEGSTFFLCTFIKGTQANLKELSDMCFL